MKKNFFCSFYVVCSLVLASCQPSYTPRPHAYNRIDLPAPSYKTFALSGYPYTFDYSDLARVSPDTDRLSEPFWVNINYPKLDASVVITYKPIMKDMNLLNKIIEDCRRLTSKHQIKAHAIQENSFKIQDGHSAYIFQLEGQVPTQFQFYTTDSSYHFLRGALYFNTATKNDSLQPVIEYIAKDMVVLLKSLKWKKVKSKK